MLGQDLVKTNQSKLSSTKGILDMNPPPTDPKVQREFINSVVNLAVECGIFYKALSGPAFRGTIGVLNKHSRSKVDVISRYSLAKHVTKNAEELLKDITAIIKSCRGDYGMCVFYNRYLDIRKFRIVYFSHSSLDRQGVDPSSLDTICETFSRQTHRQAYQGETG